MTTRVVHRPSRSTRPLVPLVADPLAAPPTTDTAGGAGPRAQAAVPAVGAVASGLMIVVLRAGNPVFLVLGALLLVGALVSGVAMMAGQWFGRARERRAEREAYLDYLERLRLRLRRETAAHRAAARAAHPAPAALLDVARDPARLWERRRRDPDFLELRLGLGTRPLSGLAVPEPTDPVRRHDPFLAAEAEAVAHQCGQLSGVPVTVPLDGVGHVSVVGDRTAAVGLVRSLLLQVAVLHAPDDVAVALAHTPGQAADWRGVDLLPHVLDHRPGEPAPTRLVAPDAGALGDLLRDELATRAREHESELRSGLRGRGDRRRRLLVVVDDHGAATAPLPLPPGAHPADVRLTVLHVLADQRHEPSEVALRIRVDGTTVAVDDLRATPPPVARVDEITQPDTTTTACLESVARTLAPLRLTATDPDLVAPDSPTGITELLGVAGPDDVRPDVLWAARAPRDFLRIPLGRDDRGAPVLLDLKESARLGMGPHGLCVGATGSGKSELLRTLVLALALTHSPDDVSMVLVDYKGGAAFAACEALPHVAGVVDNLADDPQLTARARTSIQGEVVRRQELLKRAGSLPSIGHYRSARRDRPDLPPMPHLLLVIDEFAELITADPDFVDLLVTIGRIGRSIGVHLLLSSQRVEMGKLRGLETYLSYRIGLRTFSESESAMVLDTKDAFHLPPVPGYAYLKVDTTQYTRFRAGFVSAPLPDVVPPADHLPHESTALTAPAGAAAVRVPAYGPLVPARTSGAADPDDAVDPAFAGEPDTGPTLLSACVDRLATAAPRVRPVWLRPLPDTLGLGAVLSHADDALDPLVVPVGLVDDPARQRQEPWLLDLTRAGGHLAVIGAPQSGRTTLLRTVAAAGSLTHSPAQLSFYGLDLAGGGLAALTGLPHVGGVATATQPDLVARLLEELTGMLATRERLVREHDLDSLATLRRRHAEGLLPELPCADVVLLVDGYGLLRTDHPDLEEPLGRLLQRGGGLGLHVVLGLTRWSELRIAQQSLVGTRVELHLHDPIDSVVDRRLAATIPAAQPGRALTEEGLLAQVALPVETLPVETLPVETLPVGSGPEPADDAVPLDVGQALRDLGARVGRVWEGLAAAPIRSLPHELAPDALPACRLPAPAVTVGLRQDTMGPAVLDLDGRDQHLLVLGDRGAGKTTTMRGVVDRLVARLTPDELVFAVVDVRGGLAPAVPEAYLGGHAATPLRARALADSVARELARRADPASADDGAAAPPRIVLLVDDYDVVASGGTEPLAALLPHLPAARDLALHVLLARPVAGASRALYDRTLQSVRDTAGSLLLLSGDPAEGPVLPRLYPEPLPPGRGRLVRRGEPAHLMQVAHFAPAAAVEPR